MVKFAYLELGELYLPGIQRFLPSNYTAEMWDDYSDIILIKGEDVAGWTMDDYVIPRLQSGNYYPKRIG